VYFHLRRQSYEKASKEQSEKTFFLAINRRAGHRKTPNGALPIAAQGV